MKKKLYDTQNISTTQNKLNYYLTETTAPESGGIEKIYGVEIEFLRYDGAQEKEMANFTVCRDFAVTVLQTLSRNLVTPTTFPEIVDELVSAHTE